MEWRHDGIIVSTRRHGENGVIIDLLTREQGRWSGLVRGGRSRRMRPVLQVGNLVAATWRARLEEHLGSIVAEPLQMTAARVIDDPFKLAGLTTLAALAVLIPEREPHRSLFDALTLVLDNLDDDAVWPALAVRWEMGLLNELGFGLDLSQCAATGRNDDLIYVSPKSGRAVSASAGEPYRGKLLRLPAFLAGTAGTVTGDAEIVDAFALTGYFLNKHVFEPRNLKPPEQRQWVVDHLTRRLH